MKAGIIVDNEFNNDIRVKREAEILKSEGYEIHVLCFDFKKDYPETLHFKMTRLRISRKLKDALFFFQNIIPVYEWFWSGSICRFIRRKDPDILHVHDLYMSRAAHTGIRRSGKNIPMILDLHENYPYQVTTYNWTKGFLRHLLSRPGKWQKKEHEYLGYADVIIVLSDEYREQLLKKYPDLTEKNFIVFPNVPDLSAPEYLNKPLIKNPFSNGYPVLLYYGIIAERRGIFETFTVLSELIKRGFNINLLLIGPVDKKDRNLFFRMVSSDEFKGKLIHVPWIESKDFPGYLAISDICLAPFRKNPQHESGIANKIYEYMLGGKPLVVSDCLPQKNLVEKHRCGLAFRNNKEYSEAIITLLNDELLRKTMGNNAYNAVTDLYNTSVFRTNLTNGYREFQSKPNGNSVS